MPDQMAKQHYRAPLSDRNALDAPEVPSGLVSIGRGMADMLQPIKQGYYNVWGDPGQGEEAYRAQRAEEEALYRRGLLYGDPIGHDPFRRFGQQALLAPFAGTTAGLLTAMGRGQADESLRATVRAFDLYRGGLLNLEAPHQGGGH